MKILMTVIMAMLVSTSIYAADCKEGDSCSKDDCLKLGKDFAINDGGKCVKIVAQGETLCPGIDNSAPSAKASGSGSAPDTTDTKATSK